MSDLDSELESQLERHEAGVADLIAAYEAAEVTYFESVNASAPLAHPLIASNSTAWVANADVG